VDRAVKQTLEKFAGSQLQTNQIAVTLVDLKDPENPVQAGNINVNRKPWCEGPYGREMQSVKMHAPNHRNWLTTDAAARLLTEIATGQAVSAKRSAEMMELLKRDPLSTSGDKNDQAHAYTGLALPAGSRLWSKAGWTSQTRHDAAYVELPNGTKFVLVIFTVDHANEREFIPSVATTVIEGLGNLK
jgi:beta-lactamase family protein